MWLRRIATELPRNLELAYCLLRDPRVPARNKVALAAALALIVSPLDVPAWVPVVGEADIMLLTLLATGVFVDAAPDEVVEEQRRLIELHRSRFDEDVARGQRLAVALSRRIRRRDDESVVDATLTDPADPTGPSVPATHPTAPIRSVSTGVSS